jgi:hypothetical protein
LGEAGGGLSLIHNIINFHFRILSSNKLVFAQVQGSVVPGSGLRNIKNERFLTGNHEP